MGTKPNLDVLDALRGVCALVVVALHFSENYPGAVGGSWLLPHGCLPVEYFLILTGFMFVYAYDSRWDRMTVGSFFKRRLVRMHPLVVIGSVIGACCYLIGPESYRDLVPGGMLSLGQLALLTLWCGMLLPAPYSLGWKLLHPLQGPLWTMLYIYLANFLYAIVLRRLKTWALALLAVLSVGLTFYAGCRVGGFHAGGAWMWLLKTKSGWAIDWWGNCGALARTAFPVFAGMVIARKGWRIRTGRTGLWVCTALLLGIFCAPELRPDKMANGLYESVAVVVGMPLVLLCGIGGTIRSERMVSACRFLGKFSFPLYATHYPLTLLQRIWRDAHAALPWQDHVAVCLAFFFFALINASVAMKATDWFAARMKGR